jgi:hypothetical protein
MIPWGSPVVETAPALDNADGVDPVAVDNDDNDTPRRPGGRAGAAVVVTLIAALLLALVITIVAVRDDGPQDVVVTIPAGTDSGTDVIDEIVRVERNAELVVRNKDSRLHVLGPITVEAGETARQTFPTEGRFAGSTSLRTDGRVTILVQR